LAITHQPLELRELFKASTDSGSLLVSIEQKIASFGLGFSVGDVTSEGVLAFLAELPGSGRERNGLFFWLKFFWKLG